MIGLRRIFWVAGLALAAIVLCLFAIWLGRARRATESAAMSVHQRGVQLERELAAAKRRVADAERRAAAAVVSASASTGAAPAAKPASRPPGLEELARDNPQLWNEFVASKRAEFGRYYLPAFLRLGLTVEQRERVKDILAAELARGTDIAAAAAVQSPDLADATVRALQSESRERRDRELAALLGPAAWQAFDAYERALPVRGFVDGLGVQLAARAPLTAGQADRLERVLAEASEPYRFGKTADPKTVDWAAVDRKAREILTPEQYAVWERGTAHNPMGGSRRALELQAVYDRVIAQQRAVDGESGTRD